MYKCYHSSLSTITIYENTNYSRSNTNLKGQFFQIFKIILAQEFVDKLELLKKYKLYYNDEETQNNIQASYLLY